jgi:hypothetical protein
LNKLSETLQVNLSLYYLIFSLIGLLLIVALTFTVPTLRTNFFWQRPLVATIFGLTCLLGLTAGFFPRICSRTLSFKNKIKSAGASNTWVDRSVDKPKKFAGHHPKCGNFSVHVFHLGGKTFCAGCTGLVIGAFFSFFGTLIFVLFGLFLVGTGTIFFWLGFVCVLSGLLQYNLLNLQNSFIHMFLNVVFVIGSFFLFVGIELIVGNLILDGYFLALTFFWIYTRIMLSQWEHRKICLACGLKSCGFLNQR